MAGKKRKRGRERATIHPRNKYSENPPDFGLLASLYPTFQPFVFYSRDGRPRIDWKDYDATRELTRVLLLHDHGLNWWIPDGQLCPTVPNRSNYIHWIEDLLSSEIIVDNQADGGVVRGFDIGTGANCIYPLLGSSLLGWTFVGSDVSDVALEWAEKNVKNNPHISGLIEIRKVENNGEVGLQIEDIRDSESNIHNLDDACTGTSVSCPAEPHSGVKMSYQGPPILVGVVKDEEKFDFCMCNPPFFETMEEAGLNPKTACGGTSKEMVCPGGEQAFITRIIEDSVKLKQSFRWYTSMVGRKSNLKILILKLRAVGVTIVKTTEFVQGQTCRWGLAWSFVPPSRKISTHATENNNMSFMLEGIQKQYSALHVLQSVEIFFSSIGASCKLNTSSFKIDIMVSEDQCGGVLASDARDTLSSGSFAEKSGVSDCPNNLNSEDLLHLSVSVFQQIPGTLLIKGSLQQKESSGSGKLFLLFCNLEEVLRNKFCKTKAIPGFSTSEQKIRRV